ncbi:MAG: hypothetical protein PHY43_14650 [Verrucomicrobiales bacterium]|nr:hypothetical protein [Verrucomicrobiales bacterium]
MLEIEAAIRSLPKSERKKLAEDLPSILPELDSEWHAIISDSRPRPALSALGDKIAAQIKSSPQSIPEIQEGDFNR